MHFAAPQPQAALFGISVVFLTAVWFVARWTKRWVEDPLRRIPGPRIASLTDIWRLRNALSGKEEVINLELHEEYGNHYLSSRSTTPHHIKVSRTSPEKSLFDDFDCQTTICLASLVIFPGEKTTNRTY